LFLYQGKIETDRLAGKKYSCKERVVFSTVSDGERAERYPYKNYNKETDIHVDGSMVYFRCVK
jgi:hypothetical protein